MKLTAQTIYGFAGSVLSSRFDNAVKTPDCHLEWWDLCCSDHPLVAIAAPRGHAKSTAITHCYTLASVLFEDRDFVLLVSDTYDQAIMFLNDIKTELYENEDLHALFGKIEFLKDAENDVIVKKENGKKFRIVAKGSEQKVRGLKWNGKRPNLIVCDDLENDEIVMNKDRREKFRLWFFNALLACRSDKGIVRVVGTILHMDSLLERIMPKLADRKYTINEDLRVYSSRKVPSWKSFKYRAHNSDFSKILWPEKWPKHRLIAERQKYIDAGHPEGYSQEYLNNPVDDTRAYFRKTDFLVMPEELWEHVDMWKIYISCDLAVTKDDRADYSAFIVAAVDDQSTIYVLDVIRARMDSLEIIETLFELNAKWNPEMVAIEKGLIEKSIGPLIRDEMFKRNSFFSIWSKMPTKDKESRGRSIQGRMRAGGIRFDKDNEWYPSFEEEMLSFPRGIHDDQVDAMAWLGLMLDSLAPAPSPEEMDEDVLEEERILFQEWNEGRNMVTGY